MRKWMFTCLALAAVSTTAGCGSTAVAPRSITATVAATTVKSVLRLPTAPPLDLGSGTSMEVVDTTGTGSRTFHMDLARASHTLEIRFTCVGPGTWRFADASGATEFMSAGCSDEIAYYGAHFKTTAADKTIHLEAQPAARWALQIWSR